MRQHYNKKPEQNKIKEEYAIVLDIILDNSNSFKSQDLIQAIGTKTYVLLELAPKEGANIKIGDKVYIGEGKREEIQFIKRAIFHDKLSASATTELMYTIQDIVDEREEEYVNFMNTAGPITIRKHAFEMMPGIGKKYLKDLLEERDYKGKFTDFKNIKERCSYFSDPSKSFSQRILEEIEGKTDHKFFTRRE